MACRPLEVPQTFSEVPWGHSCSQNNSMISFLFFILYICTIGEKVMMATSSVPRQEAKFCALAGGKVLCLGRRQSSVPWQEAKLWHPSVSLVTACFTTMPTKKKRKEKKKGKRKPISLKSTVEEAWKFIILIYLDPQLYVFLLICVENRKQAIQYFCTPKNDDCPDMGIGRLWPRVTSGLTLCGPPSLKHLLTGPY